METTLAEETKTFFDPKNPLYFPPQPGQDRLILHDALHTLFQLKATAIEEIVLAIYQSVLTQSTHVGREVESIDVKQEHVSIDDITQRVIPGVKRFLNITAKQTLNTQAQDVDIDCDFITRHYERAQIFALLYRHKYGKGFANTDLNTVLEQPIDDLRELAKLSGVLRRGVTL